MYKLGDIFLRAIIVTAGCLLLITCGGGGGAEFSPAIPYAGVDGAAYVTGENAASLATGIWLRMQYIEQPDDLLSFSGEPAAVSKTHDPPPGALPLLSGVWLETAGDYLEKQVSPRAVPQAVIEEFLEGDCGGYADVSGTVRENSGYFDLDVVFHDYSDDCVITMSGRSTIKGQLDPYDLTIFSMNVIFESLAVSGEGLSLTYSGIWSIDYKQSPTRETLNMVTRDDTTGKTYWMRDCEITTSPVSGSADVEVSIAGRFYDPDEGYVDLETEEPLRIRFEEEYPYQGIAVLRGAGGTGARFQILSNAAYRVTCDEDGDGEFDDFDTGVIHWPDQNNLPVAVVDDPGTAGLHCTVTLDGSASYDIDSDPIASYSWTLVFIPEGSEAVLSDPNGISPNFIPDVEGEYQFRLLVSDGLGTSLPQGTGCGVINDDLACVYVSGDFGCVYEGMRVIDVGSDPEAVAIGDVNGDDRADVVLTTGFYFDPENDYRLFVFAQDDTGYLGTPVVLPTGSDYTNRPQSVDVGDLNSDGRGDVVIASGDYIGLFYQNLSGGLDAMVALSTDSCSLIRVGDADDDGRMDIVGFSGSGNNALVILQNGSGGLDDPAFYPVGTGGWRDLELGDVNDDGRTDIVMVSGQFDPYDLVGILYQNTGGTFDPIVYHDIGTTDSANALGIGDLNGDGRDDLVVTLPGEIRVIYQNPSGGLDPAVSVDSYGHAGPVDVGDMNGDGLGDIVDIQTGWHYIELIRQGSGGTLDPYEIYLGPFFNSANSHGLALGDIDGNGVRDIVTAEKMYGLVILYDSVFQ